MKHLAPIFFMIFFCFSTSWAGMPPLTENAKSESQGQSEVVQENIADMKVKVLEKKTQSLVFKKLLKSEGFESSLPTLTISYKNEMSSRYQITSIIYSLDDERIFTFSKEDKKAKNVAKEISVFKGLVTPGNHDLSVEIIYRGNDAGVFSYVNDYKITSQTKKTFKVDKGQNLDVGVVGYEKGWALTDFKDRPDIKVNIRSADVAKDLR